MKKDILIDQQWNNYRRSYRRCHSPSLASNFGRRSSRCWKHLWCQLELYNSYHDHRACAWFRSDRPVALVPERKTLKGITLAPSSLNKPGWIPTPVLGSSQVYFVLGSKN
jgi:hypothetical protein